VVRLPDVLPCWLTLLLCLVAGQAYADALQSLSQSLAKISSYRAQFQQQILDQDKDLVQQSEGILMAARPGKLRWESLAPFAQLIVVDGSQVWRYEEDLQQVVVSPYNDDLGGTPALLLSGDIASIGARYKVAEVDDGQFELTPRNQQSLFRAMQVNVKNGRLTRLVLEDTLGQTTQLEFTAIELNPGIDPGLFNFVVPEGVDVLRDE
jgi:outer membrane lipoprotein carrier protein